MWPQSKPRPCVEQSKYIARFTSSLAPPFFGGISGNLPTWPFLFLHWTFISRGFPCPCNSCDTPPQFPSFRTVEYRSRVRIWVGSYESDFLLASFRLSPVPNRSFLPPSTAIHETSASPPVGLPTQSPTNSTPPHPDFLTLFFLPKPQVQLKATSPFHGPRPVVSGRSPLPSR